MQSYTVMNLNKRLSELESISERLNNNYEKGAWIIFEHLDGSRDLSSARLGKHHFDSEDEMQEFIDEHHRGWPPSYGKIDFIIISEARSAGKPPDEL